ncbi:MAG: hypothetical protein DHS20C16_01390 [Phycisphaerae bacterium]|nr:MAG: hypothetical protein DHS20C16_01390 [Phycisphaerae bacterium]
MAKIGQEIFQARGIDRSLFCSKCCYNLKTRPMIGRCPECGQQYDARSGSRRGIVQPQVIHWPVGDIFLTLISAGISALMIGFTINETAPRFLLWGLPFFILTVFFVSGTWRKFRLSWRMYWLQREAERREHDDD